MVLHIYICILMLQPRSKVSPSLVGVTEVMEAFVDNVRFTKDRAGFATDDPRFNPDDLPEFKHGGLAKILEV